MLLCCQSLLGSGDVVARGSDISLVVAIQARNNARLLVSGSIKLFSNQFFRTKLEESNNVGATAIVGNEKFAEECVSWVFGERGVLRFRDIIHHKSDLSPPDVILHEKDRPDLPVSLYPDPELTRNSLVYRIKDEIEFSFVVEQLVPIPLATCSTSTESMEMSTCIDNNKQIQQVQVQRERAVAVWTPFCASDMQLEFVMLDAYVRKNMTCSNGRLV